MIRTTLVLATLLFTSVSWASELPTIRLGALSFGTVNWELDTIKNNKLDEKHGFKLDVVPMGGGQRFGHCFPWRRDRCHGFRRYLGSSTTRRRAQY